MNIILASKSPRRAEILNNHGLACAIAPADVDETLPDNISMEEAVVMLALKKARACYENIKESGAYTLLDDSVIIAADTIVYKDEIMGKPADRDDAYRMIKAISGTDHYVATGVAILDARTGKPLVCQLEACTDASEAIFCDVTRVWCRELSEDEINGYIDTTEPYDKAGAYAIQGAFGRYIDRLDGDFENVVGLPYYRIEKFLL